MSSPPISSTEALKQWDCLTEDQQLDVCTKILQKAFDKRTSDDISLLIKFTEQIAFFRGLTAKAHRECCNYLTFYFAEAEEVIMKEGDFGHTFYIILHGSVGVHRYATKPGSNSERKRRSSQFLTERNEAASKQILDPHNKQLLDPHSKLQIPVPIPSLMKFENESLENSREYIPSMNVEKTLNVVNGATLKREKKILEEISVAKKGATFGERVLLSTNAKAKRKATIITKEPTYFACLDKQYFDLTLKEREEKVHTDNINFLQGLNYFKTFSYHLIEQIYYLAKKIKYRKSQTVYYEGDTSDNIYIINDGQFKLMKAIRIEDPNAGYDPNSDIKSHNLLAKKNPAKQGEIAIFGRGEMFGEYEIMKGTLRKGTVVCESHTAEAYVLSRSIFTSRLYLEPHFKYFIDRQEQLKTQVYRQRLDNISAQTNKNKNLLLRLHNSEKKLPQSAVPYKKKTSFFEANSPSDDHSSDSSPFKTYENFGSTGSLSSTKEAKGMAAQIFKKRLSIVTKDNSILTLPLSQQNIKRYSITAQNSPDNTHKQQKAKTYFDFNSKNLLPPRKNSVDPSAFDGRNSSNGLPITRTRTHSHTVGPTKTKSRMSLLFATEGSRLEKSGDTSYGLNSAALKGENLVNNTPILIQNATPSLDQPLDQNFILQNFKAKKSPRTYSPVSQQSGKVYNYEEELLLNTNETLSTQGPPRRKSIFGPQLTELKKTESEKKSPQNVPELKKAESEKKSPRNVPELKKAESEKSPRMKKTNSMNPGTLFLRKTSETFRPSTIDPMAQSSENFHASKSPLFIQTAEKFFRQATNEDNLPQIPMTRKFSGPGLLNSPLASPKLMSALASPQGQGRSRPKVTTINPLKRQNWKQEALEVQNFMEYKLTGKIKTFNPPLKKWVVHVKKSSGYTSS